VAALTAYQATQWAHPYTCAHCRDADMASYLHEGGLDRRRLADPHLLVATTDGWVCPTCDYTQDWAMLLTMGPFPNPFIDL
jgi:hypothetical protein